MISADDIDAFKDDIEVCKEAVRRYEKGLPEDRWTTGQKGMARLIRANRRLLKFIDMQSDVIAAMHQDIMQRGMEAMEAARDPMRHD